MPPTLSEIENARALNWRQSGTPALTIDDARTFLETVGIVSLLPSPGAPSFVEATLGRAASAPTLAEIADARSIAARLIAEGSAAPVNLHPAGFDAGDQFSALASTEAFPYIYALVGTREPTQPPSTKSRLASDAWKVLRTHGAHSTRALATALGGEVTEAAVLRALADLWRELRIVPITLADADANPEWDLTLNRWPQAIAAAAKHSQANALSALISIYLSAAVAATADQMESFFAPFVSRARMRDVLHGLSATRQVTMTSVEATSLLHLPGALPEVIAVAASAGTEDTLPAVAAGAETSSPATHRSRIHQHVPSNSQRASRPQRSPSRERSSSSSKPFERKQKFGAGNKPSGSRPTFAKPFAKRSDQGSGDLKKFSESTNIPSPAAAEGLSKSAPKWTARPAAKSGKPDRPFKKPGSGRPASSADFRRPRRESQAGGPRKEWVARDRPRGPRLNSKPNGKRTSQSGEFSRENSQANSDKSSSVRPPRPQFARPAASRGFGGNSPVRKNPSSGFSGRPPGKPSLKSSRPFLRDAPIAKRSADVGDSNESSSFKSATENRKRPFISTPRSGSGSSFAKPFQRGSPPFADRKRPYVAGGRTAGGVERQSGGSQERGGKRKTGFGENRSSRPFGARSFGGGKPAGTRPFSRPTSFFAKSGPAKSGPKTSGSEQSGTENSRSGKPSSWKPRPSTGGSAKPRFSNPRFSKPGLGKPKGDFRKSGFKRVGSNSSANRPSSNLFKAPFKKKRPPEK